MQIFRLPTFFVTHLTKAPLCCPQVVFSPFKLMLHCYTDISTNPGSVCVCVLRGGPLLALNQIKLVQEALTLAGMLQYVGIIYSRAVWAAIEGDSRAAASATARPKCKTLDAGADHRVLFNYYVQITARASCPIRAQVIALSEPVGEVMMWSGRSQSAHFMTPVAMVIVSEP